MKLTPGIVLRDQLLHGVDQIPDFVQTHGRNDVLLYLTPSKGAGAYAIPRLSIQMNMIHTTPDLNLRSTLALHDRFDERCLSSYCAHAVVISSTLILQALVICTSEQDTQP